MNLAALHATLENLRPERALLLLNAAQTGQLTVCDSHGRVATRGLRPLRLAFLSAARKSCRPSLTRWVFFGRCWLRIQEIVLHSPLHRKFKTKIKGYVAMFYVA